MMGGCNPNMFAQFFILHLFFTLSLQTTCTQLVPSPTNCYTINFNTISSLTIPISTVNYGITYNPTGCTSSSFSVAAS